MIIQTLNGLWQKKKRSLGGRLQKGIGDLAFVLKPVGAENNFSQKIYDNEIHWYNPDGKIEILFFYIPDPRALDIVCRTFQRTKDARSTLSCVFVHQWTDGEGNWDVFGLHPQRGLVHWNRFWGRRLVENETGPFLRDDLSSLFQSGRDFPSLNRKKWAKMLAESRDQSLEKLSAMAAEYGCIPEQSDEMVQWNNLDGQVEVIFWLFQQFPRLDEYIHVYNQIEIKKCPVTFLFQPAQPGIFDIFRLSARSYMEHHNQAK